MRAVVCMKQVVDPLIPATDLVLDQQGKKIRQAVPGPPVINGFDEQALEAALRIREAVGELEIVGLSLGERVRHGRDEALPGRGRRRAGPRAGSRTRHLGLPPDRRRA